MDFAKPTYKKRKLRLGETKYLTKTTQLVSGRSGIHVMLAHSNMDPPCREQLVSLGASQELSPMDKRVVAGGMDLLQRL